MRNTVSVLLRHGTIFFVLFVTLPFKLTSSCSGEGSFPSFRFQFACTYPPATAAAGLWDLRFESGTCYVTFEEMPAVRRCLVYSPILA